MLRTLTLFALPALITLAAPAAAQQGGFVPKPDTYICPNATGTGAVDCFLDAVDHLYTMCRHVKSIEIIEFGYEKSESGVNGAKSEYCVDKQKINITRCAKRPAAAPRSTACARFTTCGCRPS
jgi:hypothetical protein